MTRSVKTVKLSFWDSNNFGDALNTYMFKAFGVKTLYCRPKDADIIGIGSCIDSRLLLGAIEKKIPENQNPISIFGSGFHYPKYNHPLQKKIVHPETLIRPTSTYAVRGKISQKRLENLLEKPLGDIALGDPGLLISHIFDLKHVKKKYKLGIVAHFIQQNHPSIRKIKKLVDNSVIINVLNNPYKVAKQIAECEVLVSSAMHPLIIADGLGVPNRWLKFSSVKANKNSTRHTDVSHYKFDDYYSVFNLESEFIDLSKRDFGLEDVEEIKKNYAVKKEDVERINKKLINAFPYSETIKPLSKKESDKMYYSFLLRGTFLRITKQFLSLFILNKERSKNFRASPYIIRLKL